MEIREFAERVLLSTSLDEKLTAPPSLLTDEAPGPVQTVDVPGRPDNLVFGARRTAPPMPHPETFSEERRRAVAHHIMANHELQALEVMADVLLRFPDAPPEFRRGMTAIMRDEQRHTGLHVRRAAELNLAFGELPVNCYIWSKSREFGSVLDYLAGLPLTFEGRNLDHTVEFENYFRAVDDKRSAAIMRAIHRDEIRHVAFGWHWLCELKPQDRTAWETYVAHLHWPLRPEKSVGDDFQQGPRLAAGMSTAFIDALRREAGITDIDTEGTT